MADDAANGEKDPASSEDVVPESAPLAVETAPSAPPAVSELAEIALSAPEVNERDAEPAPVASEADARPSDADAPPASDADAPAAPAREPPEPRESSPYARTEPFVQERGLYAAPRPTRPWSPLRRALLLGAGFLAPCAVIALSLYFIVKGGAPEAPLAAAAGAAAVAPDAASTPQSVEGPDEEGSASAAPPSASASAGLENSPITVPGFEDEGNDEEPVQAKPAPPKHFATVQDAALGSCSTESVDGLSRQIIEQARCIKPNDFVALPKRPNLSMAPHVFPYLELAARDHLLKALDSHTGQTMTINSALRTVAQQYLVSHWSATKICGVQLATRPGESNHEIGSALDIAEAAKWRPALEAQQFRWLGASDRVHFDYKGDNSAPRTATDVLAFQKLWNKNHAEDPIPENGQYGPPTEQRLKKSPPSGFPLGSSCRPSARKR